MSVRVKICGITSPEQALMAQAAGADLLGLVVYSKSSRYVDVQQAAKIRQVIGPQTQCVVLLVNADEALVLEVIEQVKPDLLQFHGDESPEFCQQFKVPFIRAIRMREGLDIDAEVSAYRAEGGFLFDAWVEDQYGGTGHQFDWSRLPASTDCRGGAFGEARYCRCEWRGGIFSGHQGPSQGDGFYPQCKRSGYS